MTSMPLFGKTTILSLTLVNFRVSHFHVSHLTHETLKLYLQNTRNMSKTARVYFGALHPAIHQSLVHFVNLNFTAISGPIHITIQFVSQIIQLTTPNSPSRSLISQMGFNKFKEFGPKIWDRSNGHSRPQSTQTS